MELNIKTNFSTTVEFDAYKNKTECNEGLKSHNCEIGEWRGNETCVEIDLSKVLSMRLQEGKCYKFMVHIVEI